MSLPKKLKKEDIASDKLFAVSNPAATNVTVTRCVWRGFNDVLTCYAAEGLTRAVFSDENNSFLDEEFYEGEHHAGTLAPGLDLR